jgi:hypothetical protein
MNNLSRVVPGDHIDTVYRDAVDETGEFEDSGIRAAPFADIGKACATEDNAGNSQIFCRNRAAALGCVDNGRFEDNVVGK